MAIRLSLRFVALASLLIVVGCGTGDAPTRAPVTGTVTYEGEPVPGLMVTFSPISDGENINPGAPSSGITNDEGVYTLASNTGSGETGAVVGKNAVMIAFPEWEVIGENGEFNADIGGDKFGEKEVKAMTKGLGANLVVPAEGLDSADFEMTE